ncbi:MAG: hypothetical protein K2X43_08975, partial [Hyphomonadaceae bacterium]|nr:hypothetical protein [Hyphomonadaceae bacterium]
MPSKPFVSKLSPEEWAEARRLRAQGVSFADLAQRFGIHADSMGKRARREGWPTPDATAPRAGGGLRRLV